MWKKNQRASFEPKMNVNNLKIFTVLVVRKREIARIQTEKYRLCCEEGLSLNPVSAAAAT